MVGEELGSYRVVEPIGKGGMASVYVGEHVVLGHKVAIKVLHPKHLANDSLERRFFNEAKAIAAIRHSSVVQLFDFGRGGPGGMAYIVMELLEGESLRSRLRSGVMPEKASMAFARQIASGLAAAHERGIIHRDLKPDNIFLVPDREVEFGERAKVLDFGIAKQTDLGGPVSEHTAIGILVGTPAYMSPEQCKGSGVVDSRSDVYSLGVVLYRMVTSQLPFEASGTGELIGKHLYVEPRPPVELNPLISRELNEIVVRCLRKEPDERYQKMEELAEALSTALASPVAPPPAVGPGIATPSPAPAALSVRDTSFTPAGPSPAPGHAPVAPPIPPVPPATLVTVPPVLAPEEETHPTTLRSASGETSRAGMMPAPGHRLIYAGLGAVALLATILIATVPRGGDDRQPAPAAAGVGATVPEAAPVEPPTDLEPAPDEGRAGERDAPEPSLALEEEAASPAVATGDREAGAPVPAEPAEKREDEKEAGGESVEAENGAADEVTENAATPPDRPPSAARARTGGPAANQRARAPDERPAPEAAPRRREREVKQQDRTPDKDDSSDPFRTKPVF